MNDERDRLLARICSEAADRSGPARAVVAGLVDRLAPLHSQRERDDLVERAVARLEGLDALAAYLADPAVDEVIVHRGTEVWIERDGRLACVDRLPDGAVDVILQRVTAPLGRRLDRSTPILDARLPDGSRLSAVIPPVAVDGTVVAIRRHRLRQVPLSAFGPPDVVALLEELVASRSNVLVTGATSSGKTTLLAAMLSTCRRDERCVVIEDTAELDLAAHHVVRLEVRHPTAEGLGGIDAHALVRAALRLRPDRLIVGEFRGDEALATVQALNTGHDGSLATCHANSAIDGLRRIEGLVMQAAPSWPIAAIRRQVTRSIDAVVHVGRRGAQRCVLEVFEPEESDDRLGGRHLAGPDGVVHAPSRGRR